MTSKRGEWAEWTRKGRGNMKITKAFVLLAVAVLTAALPAAQEVLVRATGMGPTYRSAVNEALVSALEQRTGVTISANERAQIVQASTASSAAENGQLDDQRKLELNDSITRDLQKWAKGRIAGFTVTQDAFDTATNKYRVELVARFSDYKDPNAEAVDKRRRMAVMAFRPARAAFSWYGQNGNALDWTSALADKLNVSLTQTRKFAMLDRKYDAEVEAELARLSGANAAPADVARLAAKLGTDYLVVGEVALHDVLPPPVNPFTARALPVGPRLFAEVTYRVLIAPTGQLKWTDVVKIDASAFAVNDVASFVSLSAEAAATSIADGMMANILPFEIVSRTKDGMLVIGEGGKSLRSGEFFTVFALGETVKDTRTGETLDEVEEAVGTVQIVRVSPKLSYAQVVEGEAAKMVVGSRLRRVPPTAAGAAAQPPPNTPVKVTPTGGVVVPF